MIEMIATIPNEYTKKAPWDDNIPRRCIFYNPPKPIMGFLLRSNGGYSQILFKFKCATTTCWCY